MENLIQFISPSINMEKVKQRADVIIEQLQRPECSLPSSEQKLLTCSLCGNTEQNNFIEDSHHGMIICHGKDNQGCGYVMLEQDFAPITGMENDFMDVNEEFSCNNQFSSTLCGGSNRMRKLNRKIETDLNKYRVEAVTTSDVYKDKQRRHAYNLLNQVQLHTNVDADVINRVKHLFHQYRSKMIRIHKLELAILALFYIVMQDCKH
jgi:hypothetical protein